MTENTSRPLLAGRQSRIQAEQEAQLRAAVVQATEAATRDAAARVRRAGEEATEQVREALTALREANLTLERTQAAQDAIGASERRLERLRRSVWLGAAAALLLILLAALGGLWLGGRQGSLQESDLSVRQVRTGGELSLPVPHPIPSAPRRVRSCRS